MARSYIANKKKKCGAGDNCITDQIIDIGQEYATGSDSLDRHAECHDKAFPDDKVEED